MPQLERLSVAQFEGAQFDRAKMQGGFVQRMHAPSLWEAASGSGNLCSRFLAGDRAVILLSDLAQGSSLGGRVEELRGRSVLIASTDQLCAALAFLELDGVARRLVLWPADSPIEYLAYVIASVPVDAIVSDGSVIGENDVAVRPYVTCSARIVPASVDEVAGASASCYRTEWILLTSGTTGRPKMVVHTLASLRGPIDAGCTPGDPAVWSTFYDIRRYGGVQMFLRAMLTGGSLVLSSAREPVAEFLSRAGAQGVTHISGTPSHFRRALMSPSASEIAPQYVRLSGEIADQGIIDSVQSFYPKARVMHVFATTEAGVAFDVRDGLAGFPASLIERPGADIEMKVQDGSLRIRSSRIASRYIGHQAAMIADAEGFVDTGDMLELRDGRYYFVGRRDGVINVGGQKVHPEEVESVINRHPDVRMALVRSRKNPLLGALVVADVVRRSDSDCADEAVGRPSDQEARKLEREILQMCREALPRHKVPAAIRFVGELEVASSGKIVRRHA